MAGAGGGGARPAGDALGELGEELTWLAREAQAQVEREREALLQEFGAARVQLHAEYSQRLLEADGRLQDVLRERVTLSGSLNDEVRPNDVLTINVGGQLFSVKRETMHVCPDSFLADLFSGAWEHGMQKDSQGRPFLDVDPLWFEPLVAWLRDRKIEAPDRPALPPAVAKEGLSGLRALASYLGLLQHLGLPSGPPCGWDDGEPCHAPYRHMPSGPVPARSSAPGPAGAQRARLLEAADYLLATFRGAPGAAGLAADDGDPVLPPVRAAYADGGLAAWAGAHFPGAAQVLGGAAFPVPAAPGGEPPAVRVTWSTTVSHPAAQVVEPRDGELQRSSVVRIADTRALGTAAAVRATRGYQTGAHYWEVDVLAVSDWSYVGFVSAGWAAVQSPIGRAAHSWGVASSGAVFACGEELPRLPEGFGEGSVLGFLLDLGDDDGHRTATVFVDGRRYDDVFCGLPDTLYPAVSNMRACAAYALDCQCSVRGLSGPAAARLPGTWTD